MFPKEKRIRSDEHTDFIRGLPCVRCCSIVGGHPFGYIYQNSSDPHHITIGTNRGTALKAGDNYLVPLCREHHSLLHSKGERNFWNGNDPRGLALELFEISGDEQKAIELIRKSNL